LVVVVVVGAVSDLLCLSSSALHFFRLFIFLSTTRDDRHFLAHAMASDFSVTWQFSQREKLVSFVTDQTPRPKVQYLTHRYILYLPP
jgi:hypothetical protein